MSTARKPELGECYTCYPRIVLVGYSFGGNTVFDILKRLETKSPHMIVDAVFTIDPVFVNPKRFLDLKKIKDVLKLRPEFFLHTWNTGKLDNYCSWSNHYQHYGAIVGAFLYGNFIANHTINEDAFPRNLNLKTFAHDLIPGLDAVKDAFRKLMDLYSRDGELKPSRLYFAGSAAKGCPAKKCP